MGGNIYFRIHDHYLRTIAVLTEWSVSMALNDVKRYLENWQGEVDGAAQYHALSRAEKDPKLSKVYEDLAKMEEKHRGFWEGHLKKIGAPLPPQKPSWRARVLIWVTEKFGPQAVLSTIASHERVDRNMYVPQMETEGTSMVADERMHDRVLEEILRVDQQGASGNYLAQVEGRHKGIAGNTLRAAVLGANDGLCSNLSLVMGVAGVSFNNHILLVTGLAGLLAGACSMALGEWISVTNSRELAEREIRVESEEYDANPASEGEELQLIYESKGMKPGEAKALAEHMMSDKGRAMDALTREELGIDPEDKGGSPNVAALSSFFLFALGAIVPVFPFFFLSGKATVGLSLAASALALFAFGGFSTVFTGKPVWFAGLRQMILGLLAAALTFGLGRLLGVSLS
jgi:vacuolar iron transporter family protein